MAGKLIVIDGLDGSGKTTQQELLVENLHKEGKQVRGISFPDYKEASSALVKMYLAGEFGDNPGDVNAYAASSFYAVDRYASFKKDWEEDYLAGTHIVAARYVSSNLFHQMGKLPASQWDDYMDWAEDYEFSKLGIPRPDLVIFLDMDSQVANRLILSRYRGDTAKRDVHEKDLDYLRRCREAALYVAEKQGYGVIDCAKDGEPRSIGEIQDSIRKMIFDSCGL